MLRTSLSAAASSLVLAALVGRLLAASSSGEVRRVRFGGAYAVAVGDACLATLSDAEGGVSVEWAPGSSEAQALLVPMLAACLGA